MKIFHNTVTPCFIQYAADIVYRASLGIAFKTCPKQPVLASSLYAPFDSP